MQATLQSGSVDLGASRRLVLDLKWIGSLSSHILMVIPSTCCTPCNPGKPTVANHRSSPIHRASLHRSERDDLKLEIRSKMRWRRRSRYTSGEQSTGRQRASDWCATTCYHLRLPPAHLPPLAPLCPRPEHSCHNLLERGEGEINKSWFSK